jgi:hypothetical protein
MGSEPLSAVGATVGDGLTTSVGERVGISVAEADAPVDSVGPTADEDGCGEVAIGEMEAVGPGV